MKNMRAAIIAGLITVIAVILVIVILVTGKSGGGIYVTGVSGGVNISNDSDKTSLDAEIGMQLVKGDVLTVGEESSCTLVYRSGKNDGTSNYFAALSGTQIFITDDFDGSKENTFYLNRGTVVMSNAEETKAVANVRTSNCEVETETSVSVISYNIAEDGGQTDIAALAGNVYIRLFDEKGEPDGAREPLGPKMKARVGNNNSESKNGSFVFRYLNTECSLSDFTPQILRELFNISAIVKLEFTSDEIKEAYDMIPKDEKGEEEPEILEEIDPVGEATIQTAEIIQTIDIGSINIITDDETETDTETEVSETTTVTTEETTVTTTEKPEEDNNETHKVYIKIGDKVTEQTVAHGENAVKPEDPYIENKFFIGWDNSFNNITGDTTITALFEDADDISGETTHTVTVIIGDTIQTQEVEDGEAANIPSTITLEGYNFEGWDGDYSNITEDVTISAVLTPLSCTVTFSVDGVDYTTTVDYGGTVTPPVNPSTNSAGDEFTGWSASLSGITSDTTITAQFAKKTTATYTVTFVVEGVSYTQTVAEGENAEPPYAPDTNEEGLRFRGWDEDYSSITSDRTIFAVYS